MADKAYDAWAAWQQDVPDSARYKQVAAWWSCEASIAKYYSPNVRQQRPFPTWEQVADTIRAYTQKHGKLRNVLEWGSHYGDYQCLEAGMRKAESLDLLLPKPLWDTRPLSWWSNIRAQFGLRSQDLSLSLGKLYQLVFPERTALIGQWHNAGPDVRMTIQLIEFYFQRMSNAPTKGKITANFAPLGAEGVLDIQSDEESEGDWESDVDDDRDSDLSDEGSDMGDEVWNMGEEDFFVSEEEYDMNDENLNAAGGVSDAGGLGDY